MSALEVNGNISLANYQNLISWSPNQNFTYNTNTVGDYSLSWSLDFVDSVVEAYLSGYGAIKLFTANLPRMTINEFGSVGIGTTSPAAKLDVAPGVVLVEFFWNR